MGYRKRVKGKPVDDATIFFSYKIFVSGSPRDLCATRQRSGTAVAAIATPSFRTCSVLTAMATGTETKNMRNVIPSPMTYRLPLRKGLALPRPCRVRFRLGRRHGLG